MIELTIMPFSVVFNLGMNTLKPNWAELLPQAVNIAENIQTHYRNTGFTIERKSKSPSDVVTIADKECEEALRLFFKKHAPEYNVFGEEGGAMHYNGNGKVIIIDPIDGTKSFTQLKKGFGTLIGVYDQGLNIAGIEANTMQKIRCLATQDGEFQQLGRKINPCVECIYVSTRKLITDELKSDLRERIEDKFPQYPVAFVGKDNCIEQDVLNRLRVFTGHWAGYIHSGLARHDLAAVPIFADKTGVVATNHKGKAYDYFDATFEQRVYQNAGQPGVSNEEANEIIYRNPLIASKQEVHDGLLRIMEQYKELLIPKELAA